MRNLGGTGTGDIDGLLGTLVQHIQAMTLTIFQATEVSLTLSGTEHTS